MVLLREAALTLLVGLTVWVGLAPGTGPYPWFLAGVVATLPFQVMFALALWGATRLPWYATVVIGGAAWHLGWQYLGVNRFPWLLIAPVALILLAAATSRRNATDRASAALVLWCLPLTATVWLLPALMPTPEAVAAARQLHLTAGSVYLTIRLLGAILAPLSVDRPFLPPIRRG